MLSLKTLLLKLPEAKLRELEVITQRIADSGYAEIIHLFGSYARGDFKPELHFDQPKKSDFDLLIVTASPEKKGLAEAMFGDSSAFADITTVVQLVIETIETVNVHLKNHQFFFTDIKHEGITLLNTGRFSFESAEVFSIERRCKIAEQEFTKWLKSASEFHEIGVMLIEKGWNQKAAFNFQQSAECSYKTVELVFSQYMPHEHYLDILRKRAEAFDSRMGLALPKDSMKKQFLFEHLDQAYIGGRYMGEREYLVTKEHLNYWNAETKKLLLITQEVCQDKISKLRDRIVSKLTDSI